MEVPVLLLPLTLPCSYFPFAFSRWDLNERTEDDRQYLSLQELNDYLSMGTEETLGGFAPDEFIPPLIQLLNMDYNPEMMLLACRAIANMTEALPNSVGQIIGAGVIPVVCSKLMSIEYIDLAEQGGRALFNFLLFFALVVNLVLVCSPDHS